MMKDLKIIYSLVADSDGRYPIAVIHELPVRFKTRFAKFKFTIEELKNFHAIVCLNETEAYWSTRESLRKLESSDIASHSVESYDFNRTDMRYVEKYAEEMNAITKKMVKEIEKKTKFKNYKDMK